MVADCEKGVRQGGFWLPWRTLLLSCMATVMYLLLGPAPEALVFDRVAIAQGEWWRLITGHWVHSDLDHAVWDIGAFALMGFLFERRLGNHLLPILLLGSLGVNAWVWWGDPSLGYYCGLSGILNTMMAVGLMQLWRDSRHPLVLITGLGFVAKIMVELLGGQIALTSTAWPEVPEVHAVGLLCGMLYTWVVRDLLNKPVPVIPASAGIHANQGIGSRPAPG